MAIISFNALSSHKLEPRLRVLMHGGLNVGKHEVRVRLPAEGERPKFLPAEWEWIDWGCYLRGERHIRLPAHGILDLDADYHVFCDDDSLTDINHMVRHLDSQNEPDVPTIWTAWPGRHFPKEWEASFRKSVRELMPNRPVHDMWIGYEISIINKSLARLMNGSEHSKRILQYSDFLDESVVGIYSTPDLQISMTSWLLGARHINGMGAMCEQWPNYLNYSGINPKGTLWHIHWIDTGIHVDMKDVAAIVGGEGTSDVDEIFTRIFRKSSCGFKARDFLNRQLKIGAYFPYWHAGRVEPFPLENEPTIVLNSNKTITVVRAGERVGDGMPVKWESIPGGLAVRWNNGMSSRFRWIYNRMMVGYDYTPQARAPWSTTALMPVI
jgi:hypothetical protein